MSTRGSVCLGQCVPGAMCAWADLIKLWDMEEESEYQGQCVPGAVFAWCSECRGQCVPGGSVCLGAVCVWGQ